VEKTKAKRKRTRRNSSVTIYDVAKHSGVSVATVSRIVNKVDYPVSDTLRLRVEEAIKELQYRPNIIGRNLKSNRSNEVGVIIPNISNYYYPSLLSGINDSLVNSGYNVLLCNSYRNPDHERKQFQFLLQKQVKGIIISTVSNDTSWIDQYLPDDVTVIAIEQVLDLMTHSVTFDYFAGGYMAGDYLAKQGHRDIAFMSPPITFDRRRQRLDGFKAGLKDNGIELDPHSIRISDYEHDDENSYEFNIGKILTENLIKERKLPTAIFCINDMLALGVIGTLQRHGIRVPEDVSVMGFDNLSISSIVTPSLTTIDQCMREIGVKAIDLLNKSFNDIDTPYESFVFDPILVERESVRKLN